MLLTVPQEMRGKTHDAGSWGEQQCWSGGWKKQGEDLGHSFYLYFHRKGQAGQGKQLRIGQLEYSCCALGQKGSPRCLAPGPRSMDSRRNMGLVYERTLGGGSEYGPRTTGET